MEKFQFGHERLVMPAAEADWFTEGSKVVRQDKAVSEIPPGNSGMTETTPFLETRHMANGYQVL